MIAAVVSPVLQLKPVPPEAVRSVELPVQIVPFPEIETEGTEFTVTILVAVFVQPLAKAPTTVYVVFVVGLTLILAVVSVVLQL